MRCGVFKAIFYDAVVEHRDRKVNYFLLACSAFACLVLTGLAFRVATPQETVEEWCRILPTVTTSYLPGFYPAHPSMPQAGPVRVETAGEGERWSFQMRYGYPGAIGWAMEMWAASDKGRDPKLAEKAALRHFNHGLLQRAVTALGEAKALFPSEARATQEVIDRLGFLAAAFAAADRPQIPTATEDQTRYLEERWESFGFKDVAVTPKGDGVFALSFGVPRPKEALHVHGVTVLGLYTFDVRQQFSRARVLGGIRAHLVRGVAGADWFFFMGFGVLAALFVTAGSLSGALARGTVEMSLARPLSRTSLLLARYAAGVLFVLVHATVFFVGTALALRASAGEIDWRYLVGIPLTAGIFSIAYAVAALVAVVARTPAFAPVLATGVLIVCGQLAELYRFGLLTLREDIPAAVRGAIRVLYWILPKTVDLLGHGTALMASPEMSDKLVRQLDLVPAVISIPAGAALATTAAFVAAVLALACWLFSRKEP